MSDRVDYSYRGIFDQNDLKIMSAAVDIAHRRGQFDSYEDSGSTLRLLVVQLYRGGLREPGKLGEVASFLASSRLFRNGFEKQVDIRNPEIRLQP
jgi:hypothetical protein